jgi:hypothetical protein
VALLACAGIAAAPTRAQSPEDKFIAHLERANASVTSIPGTPDIWVKAGYASCDRIAASVGRGERPQAAVNNEVLATGAFNSLSRQNSVAIVTYAVLDLCPHLMPTPSG